MVRVVRVVRMDGWMDGWTDDVCRHAWCVMMCERLEMKKERTGVEMAGLVRTDKGMVVDVDVEWYNYDVWVLGVRGVRWISLLGLDGVRKRRWDAKKGGDVRTQCVRCMNVYVIEYEGLSDPSWVMFTWILILICLYLQNCIRVWDLYLQCFGVRKRKETKNKQIDDGDDDSDKVRRIWEGKYIIGCVMGIPFLGEGGERTEKTWETWTLSPSFKRDVLHDG